MVKYTIFLKRLDSIDKATFQQRWIEGHLPILKQLPGIRKIELNAVVDSAAYPSGYDGVGMLWFDSVEAAMAAFASPMGQAARADTPRFADSTGAMRLFVEELEVG